MDYENLSIQQLMQGYYDKEGLLHCLFCTTNYYEHEVFPVEGKFLNALGMMEVHLTDAHQSPFHALLQQDKKITGLSDVQMEMLGHFYAGESDQQIVRDSSVNSVSTVRQHRFKLREKERQAKVFLALMQLLKEPQNYQIHKGAKQVDERYAIEEQEREKILKTYFKKGLGGSIEIIPSKEKKKIVILQHIIKRFDEQKNYTEKEVNEILKGVHDDFVSLRRNLIEYGFMLRSDDGANYWVK
ncbi:MAG: DUF2087 domain-containing protein [Solibacillus sp.]|uniref:DUF2087 domain-containing protein n=1 Tax=unclassified Solibacillus TaxID=2637870 RepID=UPI0030F5B67C